MFDGMRINLGILAKDLGLAGVFLMKDKPIMKISKILALGILVLSVVSVWGQQPFGPSRPQLPPGPGNASSAEPLTKFNLDFPGGHPKDLVAAIEKATGKPLNAIVDEQDNAVNLPSLKMNNVSIPQLLETLGAESRRTEFGQTSGYSFQTAGRVANDDSIWFFHVEKPLPQVQQQPITSSCRFYLLTPYLERGLTVDDITTAIQTSWKMLGYKDHTQFPFGGQSSAPDRVAPQISYHKETKLLIAVGEDYKIDAIDAVLKALEPKPKTPEQLSEERTRALVGSNYKEYNSSTNSNQSNTNH